MKYVVLQLAMSLDGYIAREDGSVDFLEQMNGDLSNDFSKFVSTVDHILMGRNTYEVMLEFGDIPFEDKDVIVVTSKTMKEEYEHVRFVHQPVDTLLDSLEGTIWLFGGAQLIHTFIDHDWIDEYQLHIVPQIIGTGIRLFQQSNPVQGLTLDKVQQYGDSLTITYKKKKL